LTVGMKHTGVFTESKDAFTFQVSEIPHVISGYAKTSSVSSFEYSNITDEGAIARPVVSNTNVSLRSDYRQYATSFNYTANLTSMSKMSATLVIQTDNAGTKSVMPYGQVSYSQRF
jgi:hypothetical protein